jgi:hypothetical protein
VRFEDKSVVQKNANWNESYVGRVALAWTPTPQPTITPSVVFQKLNTNDSGESWDNIAADQTQPSVPFSDYANNKLLNGNRVREWSKDRFVLPSLNIRYDLGGADLIAIGSYFDRKQMFVSDYTTFDQSLFTGITLPIFPNQSAFSDFVNTQKNWTGNCACNRPPRIRRSRGSSARSTSRPSRPRSSRSTTRSSTSTRRSSPASSRPWSTAS